MSWLRSSMLKSALKLKVFGISVLKIIIVPHTSHLSSLVQSVTIDVLKVKENTDITIETSKICRNFESFNSIWEASNKKMHNILEISLIRWILKLTLRKPNCRDSDHQGGDWIDDALRWRIGIWQLWISKLCKLIIEYIGSCAVGKCLLRLP